MAETVAYCHNLACSMFDQAQTYAYWPATYEFPAEGEELVCRECHHEAHEYHYPVVEVTHDAADWLPEDPLEWDARDREFATQAQAYAAHKQEQYRRRLIERSAA